MIGRFGDQVTHLPTGRRGKVVMHPSGCIGVFSTPVDLGNGQIEEFPDSELRVGEGASFVVRGIRFASNRPMPDHTTIQIVNNGDGTVNVTGQVPGGSRVTVHNLPLQDGEIVLPDEVLFPIRR